MEHNNNNSLVKTPEAESETPTRIQSSNGVLKRHAPLHHQLHQHPLVVTYKECLKNFAASLGGHSLDGCGEFMSSSTSLTPSTNPLMCAVCGCHRNFHRRETEEFTRPVLEFQSQNRHNTQTFAPQQQHQQQPQLLQLPPPPQAYGGSGGDSGSPSNSPSPPPISSAYYPSAPQMLMALSHGSGQPGSDPVAATTADATTNANANVNVILATPVPAVNSASSRKRHRTKFTTDQKGKMVKFAEKLGWKMQKKDESVINEFCSEIGVERGVFKVWMHNNKHTIAGKDHNAPATNNNSNMVAGVSTPPGMANGNVGFGYQQQGNGERKVDGEMGLVRNPNGSSSTS